MSFFDKFLKNFNLNKNSLTRNSIIKGLILLCTAFLAAIILGILISHLNDVRKIENLLETKRPSLPSILLDRNNEIITEFYSDEKKDLITITKI